MTSPLARSLDRVAQVTALAGWGTLFVVPVIAIVSTVVAAVTGDLSRHSWLGDVCAGLALANGAALLFIGFSAALETVCHRLHRTARRKALRRPGTLAT